MTQVLFLRFSAGQASVEELRGELLWGLADLAAGGGRCDAIVFLPEPLTPSFLAAWVDGGAPLRELPRNAVLAFPSGCVPDAWRREGAWLREGSCGLGPEP